MSTKQFISLMFFFLISTSVISQSKEQYAVAKVSYVVQIKPDKDSEIYKIIEKYQPGLSDKEAKIASELEFSLIFNDSTSLFFLEKKLYSDNRVAYSALNRVKYYGRIKQQSANYITEELQEAFGKFLVSRPYQDWELHDETKTIGDYTCFKATSFSTVTNPDGKVFKYDFTAWYTPELPYKFGPAGYGNLPGLIIELQGEGFTYGVEKIQFYDDNETKENEMPTLKRKKLITEEEFERLAAEDEKRWRKQN